MYFIFFRVKRMFFVIGVFVVIYKVSVFDEEFFVFRIW